MRAGMSEELMQRAIVEHFGWFGRHDVWLFHVPNGGKRFKATAGRLKAMGATPGVADLVVLLPGGAVRFLELKMPGGRQSEAQKTFEAFCAGNGFPYAVAYSIDEGIEKLAEWGCFAKREAA